MRFNIGSAPVARVQWRDPITGDPVDDPTTAFVFTRPDGSTATPGVSHDGPGEYSAVGPSNLVGQYRYTATATGSASDRQDGTYLVLADFADLGWTPELSEVASRVPLRTIERGDPTGTLSGTFTAATLPTDTQVAFLIQGAVEFLRSRLGDVPEAQWGAATEAASLRAAAYVEQAQPADERDTALIQQLLDQADAALAAAGTPGAGDANLGSYLFPDLPPWAGGDPATWKLEGTWL